MLIGMTRAEVVMENDIFVAQHTLTSLKVLTRLLGLPCEMFTLFIANMPCGNRCVSN